MNDIDVNHLQGSIEDIMGDYVESPEYNKRIQKVNKMYYDFRSTLLPAKQPIFDQLFLEMQTINDDFAMQAFKRGITYGKSESLMKDKLLLINKTRTRLVSNYQSGLFC